RPHPYYVKQAEGYSVLDAVRNISRRDSRRRLWSHMEMLLINEKLVRRENLFRLLDVAQRYHEMRRDIVVALVSGTDAARFLERKVEPPLLGGFVLRRINQESYESGEALLTTMFDLLLVKYGEVKDMLLVEARETEGDVSFNGAAVLKDGRKVGRVDFPEIRGYLLIKNLLKSGTDIIRTKRGRCHGMVGRREDQNESDFAPASHVHDKRHGEGAYPGNQLVGGFQPDFLPPEIGAAGCP